jgi:hypothetical protein
MVCLLPSGEDEDGGVGRVRGGGVGIGDGVFLDATRALVVVFWVRNVSAVPCMWGVDAT